MKTYPKGPFLGINNRLPDSAMHSRNPQRPGDFLRDAVNVDSDNAGRIRRRIADTLVQALTAPHSLYMDSATTGYVVVSSVMYRISLPAYSQTLFKTLTTNDPVSYVPYAGSLYWSNGTDSGRIEGGLNFPMALPTPVTPAVTAIAGTMDAGWYQVATAHYNNVTGEEGGVCPSQNYHLTSAGALQVTLPGAVTGGTHINVYVSTVDGSIPMLQTTVAAGVGVANITSVAPSGRPAVQRYETPLPAGTLFLHNGALCSFSGNNAYRGIPFRPGYSILSEARIPFPAPVTNAISAQMGVYFTTTEMSYWFPGEDLKDVQVIADVLPYGAVKGTAFKVPFNSKVGWFGALGIVIADLRGEVEADMANDIGLTLPVSGCSTLVSGGGFYRVVSCGWVQNLEHGAVTRYTNYDFTSTSGGYGTKADGIYTLSGTGPVPYVVDFGRENFKTEEMKFLPTIYLGVSSETPMQCRVQTATEQDFTYTARSDGAAVRMQRVDAGKGLRSNWFNLSLVGEDDFTLASVSFVPPASTRRI